MGDATGIYSNPGTFIGAINNTGTIIGTGGAADRGIRVVGASITGGINNSGTIQGGFASIDTDQESGTPSTGTVINNKSGGLLKGDVRLSSWADTLNVFGGSTVMGNITGNLGSGSGFGNNDFVNFDLDHDGFGGTLHHGFSVYQYKITNVNTVDLTSGTLVLDDQDIVGTVTLGPGNIDPVGTFNQSGGTGISTLGLVVDAGHIKTLGPSTPPTIKTITLSTGAGQNIGSVTANTVNIGTGASFKAFPEADFYANTNIYPNVVVGLTSLIDNYAETNVTSNSPLLAAFMIENGGSSVAGTPGSDTLVLTRQAFNNPLGVGLTPNENAAGLGLEGLYKTGNSTALAIITPLFGLTGPQYAAVLKSLDGETILERPDLWQTVLDSILNRLSQGEGFNGAGFAGAMLNHGPIQVASAGFSDDDGQVAQTTPMPGPTGVVQPWSVWVRGYGVFGNGPSTINATSFSENRYGGIGGLDYHVTDNLLVGGVFNYAHGEVDLDPPTPATNKQDAYQFAAYGKYQQGPWYVNAIAGGGFTNNTETRQVLMPVGTVNGSYSGETFAAYAEGGWDLYPVTNVKLTPLVGVGYNWLRYDAFQETGAPSALHVNAATTNNLYTSLGARAQTAIDIGTSAPLVPELRVVWQHEFLDANQEMNAAFGGGTLFNVQGFEVLAREHHRGDRRLQQRVAGPEAVPGLRREDPGRLHRARGLGGRALELRRGGRAAAARGPAADAAGAAGTAAGGAGADLRGLLRLRQVGAHAGGDGDHPAGRRRLQTDRRRQHQGGRLHRPRGHGAVQRRPLQAARRRGAGRAGEGRRAQQRGGRGLARQGQPGGAHARRRARAQEPPRNHHAALTGRRGDDARALGRGL